MLAFVHIEKCAGTTFKGILKRNFGVAYCDVVPLFPATKKKFASENQNAYRQIVLGGGNASQFAPCDLAVYRRVAPWLQCVAGHSIRPCLGLEAAVPDLKYITMLREPVSRYLSYYSYGTRTGARTPLKLSWEEYVEKENFKNFQLKRLACSEDLDAAKALLAERFFLIGVTERFDEFLVLLRRKLGYEWFNIGYRPLNVGGAGRKGFPDRILEQARQNNLLDSELYRYVVDTILPAQRAQYGEGLEEAVAQFKRDQGLEGRTISARVLAQTVMSRFYLDWVAGVLRRRSGLPWRGPY